MNRSPGPHAPQKHRLRVPGFSQGCGLMGGSGLDTHGRQVGTLPASTEQSRVQQHLGRDATQASGTWGQRGQGLCPQGSEESAQPVRPRGLRILPGF